MKTISVSEAKATLSEQLRHVKRGEEVVITERGRPVARIVPVTTAEADFDDLERAGLIRRGTGKLPRGFWSLHRPRDRDASVRRALDEERGAGW